MRTISTCLSPELIHLHDTKGKIVVVVDIFRASSTMVTALSNGVSCIVPVEDLEQCRAYKNEGWKIAGERNGQQAEGFDLGNSPLAYSDGQLAGEKIAMTTTNGTRAISLVQNEASEVLIGAFLNINALINYLKEIQNDVLVFCAGWKGKFNIEDALFAGALSLGLGWEHDCDATMAMEAVFQQAGRDLEFFLQKASHAKRLQNYELEKDIAFCLGLNQYDTIVFLEEGLLKIK
ncbi:2-phosphosulfolactate phosphatase [Cyclobacterium lianum]|uniref:Probable 2-phosphosulfolactate phosphatase n=1 Tax=Cyclobacterium lianum TaxID=388280 RepID=A0A1M7Q9X9_9BACT|nr:2-phosphosulfolactate phosphatase [Cyclobacterium lianum]SHN27396.1 2-phosphosulfolactate phosphatase [Cyclobacterium lianum]